MRTEHHANLLYKNELLLVLSLGTDFSSGRFYKSQSIILRKEQEIPLIKQKEQYFSNQSHAFAGLRSVC